MLSAFACVAGIGGLSILIGHAVSRLAGSEGWTWTAPAVGLAAALCVSAAAIRLPGHGWTVLGLLVALAGWGAATLWPEVRRAPRGIGTALVTAVVVTAAVSLPFLLNQRFGLLGAQVDDDLGFHLAWADALSTGHGAFALIDRIQPGYPIGPHSLVAGLAAPFGVLPAFTGFLMVVPVLTALTALGALRGLKIGWRVLGAVLTGLPYLAASYFAEGSFKEPAMALFVLGFVLVLADLPARPRARSVLPLAVLAIACIVTFGLVGLVWPAAVLAAYALIEALSRRRDLGLWLRRLTPTLAVLAGALALAVALAAGRFSALTGLGQHGQSSPVGGNFGTTVSPLVGLGGWPVFDFRISPGSTARVAVATAIVVVALAYALVLSRRRGDWLLFAATGATAVVYAISAGVSSSYLSTKALVVVAPLLTVSIVRALFASPAAQSRWRWTRLVTALAFAAVVAWSSVTALRGTAVSALAKSDQLISQRSLLRQGATLVLFDDHYLRWELLSVRLGNPAPYGFGPDVPVTLRPNKSRDTYDFDSVPPGVLDRFRYAVTVRGPYASTPPKNWRLRRRLPSFDIWERHGPTPAREILKEFDHPGTALACAAAVPRRRGITAVRAFPVLGTFGAWRIGGAAPRSISDGVVALPPGQDMSQTLSLPPGAWDLSLRYSSWVPVSLRAGDLHVRLPVITDRPFQFRFAGTVHSRGGAIRVTIGADRGGPGLVVRDSMIGDLAATPAPWTVRTVPLSRACGAYVDWFAR